MKKVFAFCLWGFLVGQVCYGQYQTLGGFGAGGLDGNGFGDPIANDYRMIDWGYDFQTGMIINGYNPVGARNFADGMMRNNILHQNYMYRMNQAAMIRQKKIDKREERKNKRLGSGQ